MMLTVLVAVTCLLLNAPTLLILIVAVLIVTVMMLLSTAVRIFEAYIIISYHMSLIVDSNRIWNSNTFPGMVRLQRGAYSNEGRVEVYCNGQWGTICSTGFDYTDADTICKQLGYDGHCSITYTSL